MTIASSYLDFARPCTPIERQYTPNNWIEFEYNPQFRPSQPVFYYVVAVKDARNSESIFMDAKGQLHLYTGNRYLDGKFKGWDFEIKILNPDEIYQKINRTALEVVVQKLETIEDKAFKSLKTLYERQNGTQSPSSLHFMGINYCF